MSPAVCLGGSLRTALEWGAACACKTAHIMATVHAKDQGTTCHRAGLVRRASGYKEGMCEQVMGKLSRLG